MAPAVDADTQVTVNSLVEAVRQRDALMCFYWLENLKTSGRRALSYPDSKTGLCALETAVQPFHLDEPSDVLARLRAAHKLIIQVLLLAGAEAWSACASGKSACEQAEAGGDEAAVALLEQWDKGGTNWTDAEYVLVTSVREGGLEDWLRSRGFDRETECVAVAGQSTEIEIDAALDEGVPFEEALEAVKQEPQSGSDEDVDMKPVVGRSESPNGYELPPIEARRIAKGKGREVKREVVDEPPESELDFSFPRITHPSSVASSRPPSSTPISHHPPTPPPTTAASNASWPARRASSSDSHDLPSPRSSPRSPSSLPTRRSPHIPEKFRPLVELLGDERVLDFPSRRGVARLTHPTIGAYLSKKRLYKSFKDYIAAAEKIGIVRVGRYPEPPFDWVELAAPRASSSARVGDSSIGPLASRLGILSPAPSPPFPPRFNPLVEYLGRMERRGDSRPRLSTVHDFILKQISGTFEAYCQEAARLGLIRCGRGDVAEADWMELVWIPPVTRTPRTTSTQWAPVPKVPRSLSPASRAPIRPPRSLSLEPLGPERAVHPHGYNAQLWVGGVDIAGRSHSVLRQSLTNFLEGSFLERGTVWDVYFTPARLEDTVHAFVRLEPEFDTPAFVEKMKRIKAPYFSHKPLYFRVNAAYQGLHPSRSPPPRSCDLPRVQPRNGSPHRGRTETPPRPIQCATSSRHKGRSRSRSYDRRRSQSPDRRRTSTRIDSSDRYAPPESLVRPRHRVPLSPSGAEPDATPTPPAPSSIVPLSSDWLQDEPIVAFVPPASRPTSTPLDDARRLAALSCSSDLPLLPTTSAPSTFWDPLPTAPTPTFNRTLPVATTFGYLSPTLAFNSLAESGTIYAQDPDRRATLTSFLESQSSGATAHYDAFLGRIEGFSKENAEFAKLAGELAGEPETGEAVMSEESDELDEGSDEDEDAMMVKQLVPASQGSA